MNDNVPRMEVTTEECKGCGLCIEECPKSCIAMTKNVNQLGYTTAKYKGEGCTGCGFCFYACPEPSAITVYKK